MTEHKNKLKHMNLEERHYIESLTDKEIVNAILHRDAKVTRLYLYDKCYPLFKTISDKYYTDCANYVEFVNEIYVLIMTPGKDTGVAPLAKFGFRCTFTMWLKLVAENYCKQLYKRRINTVKAEDYGNSDSFISSRDSIDIDLSRIHLSDVSMILDMIHNERYRNIIKLRYIECKTNEETAEILNMTMANYYNKHKLAKKQFVDALMKEGLL